VIAPKQIENHMGSIQEEARDLVSRLIENNKKYGSTNPIKFLELNSLNVIFNICFGRKFDSVDDPDFKEVTEVIELVVKYAGLENDLATYLPILSIVNYISSLQAKIQGFIKNVRDPLFRKLIREASEMELPNVVKSLSENGFDMTEDDKVVFMCEYLVQKKPAIMFIDLALFS
jgi:hypothetical protein